MRQALLLTKCRILLRTASRNVKSSFPLVKKLSHNLFSKHLLATNVFLSVFTSGVGDVIEQMFEILAKIETEWNKTRTLKLASTGFGVGFLAHYWYKVLDAKNLSLLQKILFSQLIYSPVCLATFFVTLGILNKSSKREMFDNFVEKGKRIYIAEWMVWPLALCVNFLLIPLRYRILFDSGVSLGFDVYSSYVVYR
jgi:protein Mpv17